MFYQAVPDRLYFSKDRKYSEINWKDWTEVITQFEGRIKEWYIEPARQLESSRERTYFRYPVLALTCLLIDTLAQYYYGLEESCGEKFIEFARQELTGFADPLPKQIDLPNRNGKRKPKRTRLGDYAELLWQMRCGVLHAAQTPLYSGVGDLDGQLTRFYSKGRAKYANGSDCPTVLVDPFVLFEKVVSVFKAYLAKLRDHDKNHEGLRKEFVTKFAANFGIDLTEALARHSGRDANRE